MKLCIVLRLYPPLIAEPATVASQLSKLLVERGVEMSVVTQHVKRLPCHEVRDQVNSFRVHFLTTPRISTHNTLRMLSGASSLAFNTFQKLFKQKKLNATIV